MSKSMTGVFALCMLSPVCVQARAANLVVNGGFETGSFSGYTVTPASSGSFLAVEPNFVHSGSNAAVFGGVSTGSYDTLSQTLATTAGAGENVSFWFATTAAAPDFQALYDGRVIFDYSGQPSISLGKYVNITAAEVGTGRDTIAFRAYNVPGLDYLDDVSVNEGSVAVTPEPSSLGLLGTGLLGMAGLARRRFNA